MIFILFFMDPKIFHTGQHKKLLHFAVIFWYCNLNLILFYKDLGRERYNIICNIHKIMYVNGFVNRLETANFTIFMHFHFVYYRIPQKVVGDLVLSSLLECMKLLKSFIQENLRSRRLWQRSKWCQGEAFEKWKRSGLWFLDPLGLFLHGLLLCQTHLYVSLDSVRQTQGQAV